MDTIDQSDIVNISHIIHHSPSFTNPQRSKERIKKALSPRSKTMAWAIRWEITNYWFWLVGEKLIPPHSNQNIVVFQCFIKYRLDSFVKENSQTIR